MNSQKYNWTPKHLKQMTETHSPTEFWRFDRWVEGVASERHLITCHDGAHFVTISHTVVAPSRITCESQVHRFNHPCLMFQELLVLQQLSLEDGKMSWDGRIAWLDVSEAEKTKSLRHDPVMIWARNSSSKNNLDMKLIFWSEVRTFLSFWPTSQNECSGGKNFNF